MFVMYGTTGLNSNGVPIAYIMFVIFTSAKPLLNSADFTSISNLGCITETIVPIILFLSQPVFPLSPYCCMPHKEATNTNFKVISIREVAFCKSSSIEMELICVLEIVILSVDQ